MNDFIPINFNLVNLIKQSIELHDMTMRYFVDDNNNNMKMFPFIFGLHIHSLLYLHPLPPNILHYLTIFSLSIFKTFFTI